MGDWNNDKQHGQGRETWTDGSKFEGHYANGCKCGVGKYDWANNGCTFIGDWLDNNIEGVGQQSWQDGKLY